MGYKPKACTECTNRCLLNHGKGDPSPSATCFFKVLVGDSFSKVLFLPPKFARTVNSMVGKKTYLEDLNGQRWKVKLSTNDDSLAFRKGWDEFASAHFLEEGQFLVFTYIIGSHFLVQIFDKSACEKLNFSQNMNNGGQTMAKPKFSSHHLPLDGRNSVPMDANEKFNFSQNMNSCGQKNAKPKLSSDHLPLDGRNSVPMEANILIIDRDSMNEEDSSSTVPSASNIKIVECDVKDAEETVMADKCTSLGDIRQERPKSVPAVDCAEVPFYIIDRDLTTKQEETRTSLFDLSNFEIFRDQSGADRMENVSVAVGKETPSQSHHGGNLERPQALVREGTVDKDPVAVEGVCSQASFGVTDLEMTEMDCSVDDVDKVSSTIKKDSCCHSLRPKILPSRQPDEKEKGNSDMSNIVFAQYPLAARRNFNDLGNKPVVKSKMEETPLVGSSGSVRQIITKVSGAPFVLEGEKGKGLKVVKKEHEEMIKEANGQPDEKKGNSDMSNIFFGQYPRAARWNFNDLGNKPVVKSKMEETPLVGSGGSVRQIITKVSGAPFVLEGEKGKGLKVVKKEHEEMIKEVNGKKSKTIKEEFEEKFSLSSKDKEKAYKAVKTEPMDSDDFSSPDLIDICDSVTAVTQSWLELPTDSASWKGTYKMDRKLVLLRDPAMKLWPVLYLERPGFRVLCSGWEGFAKANNIQPGDVCDFEVESKSEGLFRVNIVRRFNEHMLKNRGKEVISVVFIKPPPNSSFKAPPPPPPSALPPPPPPLWW